MSVCVSVCVSVGFQNPKMLPQRIGIYKSLHQSVGWKAPPGIFVGPFCAGARRHANVHLGSLAGERSPPWRSHIRRGSCTPSGACVYTFGHCGREEDGGERAISGGGGEGGKGCSPLGRVGVFLFGRRFNNQRTPGVLGARLDLRPVRLGLRLVRLGLSPVWHGFGPVLWAWVRSVWALVRSDWVGVRSVCA
jgi:hypothetical protein